MSQGMAGARNTVVLIVDDDPITAQMLVGILRQIGLQTACAATGNEGIALARKLRPDLILLDVHLPDMDGFAICRDIQGNAHPRRTLPSSSSPPMKTSHRRCAVSKREASTTSQNRSRVSRSLLAWEPISASSTAYDTLARLQAERIERLAATQQMILPLPCQIPDARFAVSLKQVHGAGGDFYDVLKVGDYLVDYMVADASGHDLETVPQDLGDENAVTRTCQAAFRSIGYPAGHQPVLVPCPCRKDSFSPCCTHELNRQTGRLTLVNGGHPPAICVQKGTPSRPDPAVGGCDRRFQGCRVRDDRGSPVAGGTASFCIPTGSSARSWTRNGEWRGSPGSARPVATFLSMEWWKTVTEDMLARNGVQDDIVLLGVEM